MKVNNVDITVYEAELVSKIINPSDYENTISFEDGMLLPIVTRGKFKLGSIDLGIIFKGATEKDVVVNQSNFNSQIATSEIIFKLDTGLYEDITYVCVLNNARPEEEIFIDKLDNKYTQKLNYKVIILEKKLLEVVKTMEGTSITFNNEGNCEVPATVEIRPTLAIATLKITGLSDDTITVNNLVANKTVIFEDGKVTVDGANKFNDCDLWEFPRIKPGSNTVTIDKTTANVVIKYNPRFK